MHIVRLFLLLIIFIFIEGCSSKHEDSKVQSIHDGNIIFRGVELSESASVDDLNKLKLLVSKASLNDLLKSYIKDHPDVKSLVKFQEDVLMGELKALSVWRTNNKLMVYFSSFNEWHVGFDPLKLAKDETLIIVYLSRIKPFTGIE